MTEKTELIELSQESSENKQEKPIAQINQHSIYDYLREHPTVLIACISGLVAVMSFVFNYAINLYNEAYLHYWNVDVIYAVQGNAGQVYIVLFAFLYCLALLLIHGLMSQTSDAYRHYNRLLSALNCARRDHKMKRKELKKGIKQLNNKTKTILLDCEEEDATKDSTTKEAELKSKLDECNNIIRELSEAKKGCSRWVWGNILIAVFFAILIGTVMAAFPVAGMTWETIKKIAISVSYITFFDMLIYFVPAYFSSRYTKETYKKIDFGEFAKDMLDYDNHKFPLSDLIRNGAKSVLTNKKLKLALVQVVAVVIFCLHIFSTTGATSAEQKKDFPIISDETGVYAVVYNNGESLILEKAEILEAGITIDITKQKIIPADNVEYEIQVFDSVIVLNSEDQ